VTNGGRTEIWTGAYESASVGGQPFHDDRGKMKGLNKDNPSRGNNHYLARRLATRASKEWYKRFMLQLQSGSVNDAWLFTAPGMQVNEDMGIRAGEGSAAAASIGKALGILEK